jgi:hypothetical protein
MLVLLLVPCCTCLQEPAQRVGGQGCKGRRAPSSSSALGAAQGRHQHHSVAAPGRRVTGRVSAVCGIQGDAGAVRPACDLHGGTRAVVLRAPHRGRCTASQAYFRAAAVQVQQGVSSVMQRLQECCGNWLKHSCQMQKGCGLFHDCCFRILSLDDHVGGNEDRMILCMARQRWGCAQCIVLYLSVLLHTTGHRGESDQHALQSDQSCWVCKYVHAPCTIMARTNLCLSSVLWFCKHSYCSQCTRIGVHNLLFRPNLYLAFVQILSACCGEAGWKRRCLITLCCILQPAEHDACLACS